MENEITRKIVIPQIINTDREYRKRLIESFDVYIKYISANKCFELPSDVINGTESICQGILKAFDLYFEGRIHGYIRNRRNNKKVSGFKIHYS